MKKRNLLTALAVAAAEISAPVEAKEAVSHFTVRELTRSATAVKMNIDNTPPPELVDNIRRLIDKVLDPARESLGRPVYVNSGYRCEELNRAVGGVAKSYHLQGRAADLDTGSRQENLRLWSILRDLPHVELICEHGGAWIHVAY